MKKKFLKISCFHFNKHEKIFISFTVRAIRNPVKKVWLGRFIGVVLKLFLTCQGSNTEPPEHSLN